MTPERQRLRDDILAVVLSADESQRAAIVGESCASDSEMLADLQELLGIHDGIQPDFLRTSPATSRREPQSEDSLFTVGRYQVKERIGSGGTSSVYRAVDPQMDRQVALKLITSVAGETNGRKLFLSEVQALGRISDPSIVRIYDCGEFEGRAFIVMELFEGMNLSEAIAKNCCGTSVQKIGLVRQLAAILERLHALGIIHRDIKPSNVFLLRDGGIKLMDFGISRFLSNDVSQSGALTGTLLYMSPEQLQGHRATIHSEIYAWGVLAYELLSGRHFAAADSVAEIVDRILNQPFDAAPLIAAALPGNVIRLIEQATAKDSSRRPQSASELFARIDASEPEDTVAKPFIQARRPFRLQPGWAFAAVTTIAVVCAWWVVPTQRVTGGTVRPIGASNASTLNRNPAANAPTATGVGKAEIVRGPAATARGDALVVRLEGTPTHSGLNTASIHEVAAGWPLLTDNLHGTSRETVVVSMPENKSAEAIPSPAASSPVVQPEPLIDPEQREWARIRQSKDLSAFRAFLASNPTGIYSSQAREAAAQLEYEKLRGRENQPELLTEFARNYPEHPFAKSALSILNQIALRTEAAARIRETINRYADAYCARKIEELSRYRQISKDDRKTLLAQFRDAREIKLTLTPTRSPEFTEPIVEDVSASGNMPSEAVIQTTQRVRIVSGDGTILPVNQLLNIHLRRLGSDWVITSL